MGMPAAIAMKCQLYQFQSFQAEWCAPVAVLDVSLPIVHNGTLANSCLEHPDKIQIVSQALTRYWRHDLPLSLKD
jgi:hypothetical protein